MKTTGVKALVGKVLNKIDLPYSMHVIDDVFHAIENDPNWLRQYNVLCDELGKSVVNNWCGQWTAHALGKRGEVQVPARKSTLIGSYSLLDTDARPRVSKPTEQEALLLMATYFQANRASLPAWIKERREDILELIMDGVPVEDAFSLAQMQTAVPA